MKQTTKLAHSFSLDSLNLVEVLSSKKGQQRNQTNHQKKLNAEFIETVAAVVQSMIEQKAQQKAQKKVTQAPKLILVKQPYYAKNGDVKLPMVTTGTEHNIPSELNVVKIIGDCVITVERFRARLPQYISLRKVHTRDGMQMLGLREVENQNFTTTEEALNIIAKLEKGIGK